VLLLHAGTNTINFGGNTTIAVVFLRRQLAS
jgi:hypothetical protein